MLYVEITGLTKGVTHDEEAIFAEDIICKLREAGIHLGQCLSIEKMLRKLAVSGKTQAVMLGSKTPKHPSIENLFTNPLPNTCCFMNSL